MIPCSAVPSPGCYGKGWDEIGLDVVDEVLALFFCRRTSYCLNLTLKNNATFIYMYSVKIVS